jgi:hypothetical protein
MERIGLKPENRNLQIRTIAHRGSQNTPATLPKSAFVVLPLLHFLPHVCKRRFKGNETGPISDPEDR